MSRLDYPATHRNREPILDVLEQVVPSGSRVLEIASGSGQHAAFLAPRLDVQWWQPTDRGLDQLASIAAWAEDAAEVVREPVRLDVTERPWPVEEAEIVFCANMIHIAPWRCTPHLLAGAAEVLVEGGRLVLYGPFKRQGEHTAPSNASFDASLQARNPDWGVRDLQTVADEAAQVDLRLNQVVPMPANNLIVQFVRR